MAMDDKTLYLRRRWNAGVWQDTKWSTDDDRERIERDTEAFLAAGGKITVADDNADADADAENK